MSIPVPGADGPEPQAPIGDDPPTVDSIDDEGPNPEELEVSEPDDDEDLDPESDDYGPPFVPRSFGGEFVWAKGGGYTCKILRVRPGENVVVSTQGRKDMFAMLTGGRGVLEVHSSDGTDRVELLPASPVAIRPGHDYRLVALTEVELYTIYSPA